MPPVATRIARYDVEPSSTRDPESDAVSRLRPLLAAAAALDLQDREGGVRLRHAARVTTAALAASEALPEHLVVGPDDSPTLVVRTIAAGWRHATSAPSRRIVGRPGTDPARRGLPPPN